MSSEIVNGIVETAQHFPPDLLAFYGALAFGILTAKQREWILKRDNHDCQGRTVMMSHRCLHDELQCHHIRSQMEEYNNGATEEEVDSPENLITLCSVAHVDSRGDNPNAVHNDQYWATCAYRGGNKNAFKELQEDRAARLARGEPHHNDRYDRGFLAYARDATRKFKEKGNEYPKRNRRG